ncbi:hypothetical protein QQ045_014950 [Rhodiola kirilowii]
MATLASSDLRRAWNEAATVECSSGNEALHEDAKLPVEKVLDGELVQCHTRALYAGKLFYHLRTSNWVARGSFFRVMLCSCSHASAFQVQNH